MEGSRYNERVERARRAIRSGKRVGDAGNDHVVIEIDDAGPAHDPGSDVRDAESTVERLIQRMGRRLGYNVRFKDTDTLA